MDISWSNSVRFIVLLESLSMFTFRLHALETGRQNWHAGKAAIWFRFTFLSSVLVRSDLANPVEVQTQRWRKRVSITIDQVRLSSGGSWYDIRICLFRSDLSEITAIKKEDVLAALQNLNIIRYQQGSYVLSITKDIFDSYQDKRRLRVEATSLFWTPRVITKPTTQFQSKWSDRSFCVSRHIVQNEKRWVVFIFVAYSGLFSVLVDWFPLFCSCIKIDHTLTYWLVDVVLRIESCFNERFVTVRSDEGETEKCMKNWSFHR